MLTIDGLATGLDTTKVIEGLLSIQQRQIDLLEIRKQDKVAEQTAFKGIEARLLSLRNDVSSLSRSVNSVFRTKTANSSDETIVSAAAGETASPGVYNIRVNALARANQIVSQGFADADSEITQGTIGFQVGSGATTTITIDGTNNTLQALADAINTSDAEVSATIINDGSGSGTPYQLLLTADKTGAANTITVTNNLGPSSGNAIKPDFASQPVVQAAADTSISLGSGAGAITVLNESNQIDNLITGVTLQLASADSSKDVTIAVSSDTQSAKTAITDFVDSFNDLMEYIDDQSRFDAETGQASVLLGNRNAISIQDQIRRTLSEGVAGVNTQVNRLSAVGVTFTDSGRLTVNSAKLDQALGGQIDGVSLADVQRLFSLDGDTDNANIQFVLGSVRTKETTTAYQIDITQAAERGSITATNALAVSTVINSSNNSLTITVDAKTSTTITLTDGTYTRQQLADHVESVINANADLPGRSVSVALQTDKLQITSDTYGISSEVTIGTGSAISDLGFSGTESDIGQDVVGKFVVNGVDETATGSGRLLIGDSENANTADLQVQVTLTTSQVQPGTDANITVTRGLASKLDQILNSLLDPFDGKVKITNDAFDATVKGLDESIEKQNESFEAQQAALIAQFIALETVVSQLQATGNFLTAQLANLPRIRSQNNS